MRTQLVVTQAVRRIWPHAESAGAGRPGPDLLGTPGVDVEVAARRGLPIVEKMKQLRGRATDGVVGAVVLRPDGMGEASVDDWPVFMRLADWLDVMAAAGYGSERPQAWTDPAPRVLDDDLADSFPGAWSWFARREAEER